MSKEQKEYIKKTIAKDLKAHFGNKKITFGKYKDREYEQIPLYYLQWLLRNKDKFIVDEDEYMFTD